MNKITRLQNNVISPVMREIKCTQITLYDNRKAIIDGAKCIVEYTPESVKFALCEKCLKISGYALTIKTLCDGIITVDGEILSVDFSS